MSLAFMTCWSSELLVRFWSSRTPIYNITKRIPSLADPGPELMFHSVTRVAPKPSWYHEVGGSVVTEECYISYEYYLVVACMQIWIHGQHIKGSDNSQIYHWWHCMSSASLAVQMPHTPLQSPSDTCDWESELLFLGSYHSCLRQLPAPSPQNLR